MASCDTDGHVKFWDIRQPTQLDSIDFGPHSANKLSFDPSGQVLAVAGNDGTIRVYHSKERNKSRNIVAHEDAAQSVLFDRSGDYLVTASSGILCLNTKLCVRY